MKEGVAECEYSRKRLGPAKCFMNPTNGAPRRMTAAVVMRSANSGRCEYVEYVASTCGETEGHVPGERVFMLAIHGSTRSCQKVVPHHHYEISADKD